MSLNTSILKSKGPFPEARSIINALLLAEKNMSIYAEGHTKFQTPVMALKEKFDDYLKYEDELCIFIRKDRLLADDQFIYKGEAKEGDLAFALFRDGMQKLLFLPGIDFDETMAFVKIYHKYKVIPPEAEGDIVTAIWEAQLTHIQYEAALNSIDTDTDSDGEGDPDQEGSQTSSDPPGRKGPTSFKSLASITMDTASAQRIPRPSSMQYSKLNLIELTLNEVKQIKEMVRDEERRDASREILNMLADILKVPEDREFFNVVLEYLFTGLHRALTDKDFSRGYQILKKLDQVRMLTQESAKLDHPAIEEFFHKVASRDFLSALQGPWPELNESKFQKLKQMFLFMPPSATIALGSLLSEDLSPTVKNMIVEVIAQLSERDPHPLETLLDSAKADLLCRLLPILPGIEETTAVRILINFMDHPDERVRMKVLSIIMLMDLWLPDRFIALVDDKSSSIRQKCLAYLGSRRSQETEMLLWNYLNTRKFKKKEQNYQLACYQALGKCGTEHVLPYLEDALLNGGLYSKFVYSPRRQGAALALKGLREGKANDILAEASKSRFPGIRKVVNAALELN